MHCLDVAIQLWILFGIIFTSTNEMHVLSYIGDFLPIALAVEAKSKQRTGWRATHMGNGKAAYLAWARVSYCQ